MIPDLYVPSMSIESSRSVKGKNAVAETVTIRFFLRSFYFNWNLDAASV